jgi:arylsulfatase A-like enzyme
VARVGRSTQSAWRGRVLVTIAAAAFGCDAEPPRGFTVRRLGDAAAFTHCAAEFKGETRPSMFCPKPIPVAVAKDVPVPAGGILTVALDGREVPAGPVQLSVEAYTYGDLAGEPVARTAVDLVEPAIASRQTDRLLEATVGHLPSFHALPRVQAYMARLPGSYELRISAQADGSKLVYVVWAWPVSAEPEMRVPLERVTPAPGAALSIAFAVAEPGWATSSSPALFTVTAEAAGGAVVLWNRQLDPQGSRRDRGWQTAEVDLSRFAGTAVVLRLAARTVDAPGSASFPIWARPVLLEPARRPDPRPSILFVSLDTVRADHLSAYGYERRTSPTLERLAREGVLFEQATSHFPSTTASHMSMFTSLQPCAHRVTLPVNRLPTTVTTLAEALADAGYDTAAVTEDALITGDAGFHRGFDEYRDLLWTESVAADAAGVTHPPHMVTGLFGQGLELASTWIERHADRPFFFFLHTYQPHVPFKVPAHYRTLFPVDAGAPEARRQAADYDAGLLNTDDLFLHFIAALERRGILDRTLVVVTSDHGTEFGEHGGIGHARSVYDDQVHVPLIFRHPKLATGGKRIPAVVPLLDLAPTLMELAGAPAPASFRGRSLAPFLRGETPPTTEPRVFAEQLWGGRQTLLRDGRWAWIKTTKGTELYDMSVDPHQQKDLAASDAQRAADGDKRIDAFRKACAAEQQALRAGGESAPLDPQRKRALEALGYVQ